MGKLFNLSVCLSPAVQMRAATEPAKWGYYECSEDLLFAPPDAPLTFLLRASAPWDFGPQEWQQCAFCFLSCSANGRHHGESWRQESQAGVCIPFAPSLPGCHGCLSGYLRRLSPLAPAASPMGGKGSLLPWSRVPPHPWLCFLNPTRTFVNIPFILFASIYPIRVCHLFPARSLTNRMSSSL